MTQLNQPLNQSHYLSVVTKILSSTLIILLAIATWYLTEINSNFKSLSSSVAEISTATKLMSAKIDQIDVAQKRQDIDFKDVVQKIQILDKDSQHVRTILEQHEKLIADKRRCVACKTPGPLIGTDE